MPIKSLDRSACALHVVPDPVGLATVETTPKTVSEATSENAELATPETLETISETASENRRGRGRPRDPLLLQLMPIVAAMFPEITTDRGRRNRCWAIHAIGVLMNAETGLDFGWIF